MTCTAWVSWILPFHHVHQHSTPGTTLTWKLKQKAITVTVVSIDGARHCLLSPWMELALRTALLNCLTLHTSKHFPTDSAAKRQCWPLTTGKFHDPLWADLSRAGVAAQADQKKWAALLNEIKNQARMRYLGQNPVQKLIWGRKQVLNQWSTSMPLCECL